MKYFLYVVSNNDYNCGIIEAKNWQEALVKLYVYENCHNNVAEKAIRNMDKFEDAKVIFDKFSYDASIVYFGEANGWYINNLNVLKD